MNLNEIGSEFWNNSTPCDSSGFKFNMKGYKYLEVLSGRTALDLIVKDILLRKTNKKVYLPSYCCHTMIVPFVSNGVSVEFYDVFFRDGQLRLNFDIDNDCDVVFFIDYFGFNYFDLAPIIDCQHQKGKFVIFDVTHSVFNDFYNENVDYFFASYRKWLNVNLAFCAKRGDFLYEIKLHPYLEYINLRNCAFQLKEKFLLGENVKKDDFRDCFFNAEAILENNYQFAAGDKNSSLLISKVSVHQLKAKRCRNAEFLIENMKLIDTDKIRLIFSELKEGNCPLFVPLFVKERDKLKSYLIKNNIYCPTHWEISDFHHLSALSQEIYRHEISIICDQRYEDKHMRRIVNCIKEFCDNE